MTNNTSARHIGKSEAILERFRNMPVSGRLPRKLKKKLKKQGIKVRGNCIILRKDDYEKAKNFVFLRHPMRKNPKVQSNFYDKFRR